MSGRLLTVGVTGRSGSGKSTVAAYYAGLGYTVADGDVISRQMCMPGTACLKELAAAFGPDILDEEGALNRKALGALAFKTPQANQRLVDITHPHIIGEMLRLRDEAEKNGEKLFFADGAMIVGGALQPYCQRIVVVTSPQRLAISRIVLRDGISKTAVQSRLAAQLPEETLRAAANYVIENDGSRQALLHKAQAVLHSLLQDQLQMEEAGREGKA